MKKRRLKQRIKKDVELKMWYNNRILWTNRIIDYFLMDNMSACSICDHYAVLSAIKVSRLKVKLSRKVLDVYSIFKNRYLR